jgi:hypothetical protein
MEEDKKQQPQQEEKEQDKKKYTLKVVVTTVIATLLLIAILLLCVLFGLKNCSNKNNGNQSTSSQIVKDEELNNRFLDIVKKQMVGDGYDEDTLTQVVVVTASDNYPNSFTLDITVKSNSKLYYYSASDVNYKDIDGNKDSYSNLVSYLKLDKSDYLDGDISLLSETISDIHITTTKQGKWTIGVNTSNEYHLSGYYLEDNTFHIYHKRLVNEVDDPFIDTVEDYLVKSGNLLYDYYLGLTI